MTQPLTDEVKLAVLTLVTECELGVKWWKGSPTSSLSWVTVVKNGDSFNEAYDSSIDGEAVKALARGALAAGKKEFDKKLE